MDCFHLLAAQLLLGVGTEDITESKLTNFNYLEKICDVQLVDEQNGDMYYLLDSGKGMYISLANGNSMCLLVRDGELYGRNVMVGDKGVIVTLNLHDTECKQTVKTMANGAGFYFFSGKQLQYFTEEFRGMMTNTAKSWGLDEYIKK